MRMRMRSVLRVLLAIALLATLVVMPTTAARSDTSVDVTTVEVTSVGEALDTAAKQLSAAQDAALPVGVELHQCPEGYTGVVIEVLIGDPPQHVIVIRACQNILP
jgi:ABC-type glycerol-3-phosphate transport system substrate-binding protein